MSKSPSLTKEEVKAVDGETTAVLESGYSPEELEMSPEETKRLLRKIDWKVIPFSTLLYLLSFLDRINIGQARVYGLEADLGMTPSDYALALSIFFVGYVIVEIPANMVIKKVKPHRFITAIMILWSICMICMGLVRNAAQLTALRFFLGIFEGPLFPCLNFVFSFYYTRSQIAMRVAIFFAGATLAGAFGGLIGYGIEVGMDGVGGYESWRWIFILEGLATILFAIPAWWLIPGFLDEHRMLTPLETAKWQHYLRKSHGVATVPIPYSSSQVWAAVKDWRMYVFSLLYICIAMPLYSLALFTPSIIKALGYKAAEANLLSVPPYALGFVTTLSAAFLSDRFIRRGPFVFFFMSFVVVGYAILISNVPVGVKYFAIFLTVAGVSPSIAMAISWVGNNFGPIYKRAIVMGLFFTTGNSAGLISSNVYPAKTGPRFVPGHATCLAFGCTALVCCAVLMWDLRRQNEKRDKLYPSSTEGGEVDVANVGSPEERARWGYPDLTEREILEQGDKHNGFRYIW